LFECVSAYGCVGLSLGYGNYFCALSVVFHPFSKFCVIILMIMGKHRGLPLSVDRALQLPAIKRDKRKSRAYADGEIKGDVSDRTSLDFRRSIDAKISVESRRSLEMVTL